MSETHKLNLGSSYNSKHRAVEIRKKLKKAFLKLFSRFKHRESLKECLHLSDPVKVNFKARFFVKAKLQLTPVLAKDKQRLTRDKQNFLFFCSFFLTGKVPKTSLSFTVEQLFG